MPHRFPPAAALILMMASAVIAGEVSLPGEFHFPAIEPYRMLDLRVAGADGDTPRPSQGKMVVDGHVTEATWPEHPPAVYTIADGLYLLDDHYSGGGDFVWDRARRRLLPIGQCYQTAVPGLGIVTVRRTFAETPAEQAVEVLDFNPATGEPRVLIRRKGSIFLAVLGGWQGKLAIAIAADRAAILAPGEELKTIDVELGAFHWLADGDSVRDGKALVLGALPGFGIGKIEPYTVPVGICDLTTGQTRPIGRIRGGWTTHMNVPQPAVHAAWISRREAEERAASTAGISAQARAWIEVFGGPVGYVLEETGEIWSPGSPESDEP